jgi:hypothetical protein
MYHKVAQIPDGVCLQVSIKKAKDGFHARII